MAVATITLESDNGDSVVVSDSNDAFLADEIILDTDPKSIYDTGFSLRTQSGAFEPGGRIVGDDIPIRVMTLPFHLTKASRRRFQRLWGTPKNLRKVRWHYDGPSGRRSLTLKLSKEILYTTEDGFDADIDDEYHAVVTALAINPMFEGEEDVSEWVNPDDRFTLKVEAIGGVFPLAFAGQSVAAFAVTVINAVSGTFTLAFGGNTTTALAYNAAASAVQSALAALPSIGAGNVTVTGTPGNYQVLVFNRIGTLTASWSLGGLFPSVGIAPGMPYNVAAATLEALLAGLPAVGAGNVTVTGTPATPSAAGEYLVVFARGVNGALTGAGTVSTLTVGGIWGALGWEHGRVSIDYAPNTGWFKVWNPTDQDDWLEWAFDPAKQWQFPDFAFGQERKWNRAVGEDAARMIVTPELTQLLSVMSDPFMDTYVNADLSNAAGLFNGVEPLYPVPQYTGTEDDPILMPVICKGPAGAKATLRQRRFWSSESGLEEP